MDGEQQRNRELGDFLKKRRQSIAPVGLDVEALARRRTPGLRREEVAQMAGISLTWYTWLEQGRPIQVSTSVVESLTRVLQLDAEEQTYLYRLSNQPLPSEHFKHHNLISSALQHVLDNLSHCPSLITDQRWNVIGWNAAASTIFGDFEEMNELERNIVWAMFTDAKYKTLFVDWERHAKGMVGRFRASCGKFVEDPWFKQFVENLKAESADFNRWWPLHEIKNNGELYKQLMHPIVGRLDFEISNFDVSGHSDLKMAVHIPEPGTDTDEKMTELLKIAKEKKEARRMAGEKKGEADSLF
ncbi:helix-turn-helix transcriptional regulator [Acetobacterium wieringae]|uniref:helix-turn-helix transcriptional regulator n=1 Tax=Acetobacterium wieringae TaxID=52694 RepID=UPI0026F0CF7E|nr:helix-turn-helix transcriptional regulator [Acetobacterium wieringae]